MAAPIYDHTEFYKRAAIEAEEQKQFPTYQAWLNWRVASEWAVVMPNIPFDIVLAAASIVDVTGKANTEALRAAGVEVESKTSNNGVVDYFVNGTYVFYGWTDEVVAKIPKF